MTHILGYLSGTAVTMILQSLSLVMIKTTGLRI